MEIEEENPDAPANATIVWLHGIGQRSHTLIPVAQQLGLAKAGIRGVFPSAPELAIGRISGLPVTAWFDQNVLTLDIDDITGFLVMQEKIAGLIAHEADRLGTERVVLAGFSQGAVMALTIGLLHPERLAGLALYAPFLPSTLLPFLQQQRPSYDPARLPVWIGHGRRDWVVPIFMGEQVRNMLMGWGYPTTWQRYRGGHKAFTAREERLASLRRFFSETLGVVLNDSDANMDKSS